jgi:hypothetical protein
LLPLRGRRDRGVEPQHLRGFHRFRLIQAWDTS